MSLFHQIRNDRLHQIDGNGKADALCVRHNGSRNPNDFAATIHERAARVAVINWRIYLNQWLLQSKESGGNHATNGGDDAAGKALIQSQRISQRHHIFPDFEMVGISGQ